MNLYCEPLSTSFLQKIKSTLPQKIKFSCDNAPSKDDKQSNNQYSYFTTITLI
nr:MAG TPA_asm: hypothetical protein [Caudoviricetes sp.]